MRRQNPCCSVEQNFPFSAEELTIYHKLRCLIKTASCVKKRLKEIDVLGTADAVAQLEKQVCEGHLARLREDWASWKEKSAEAATRRMVALGHIDPKNSGLPNGCEGSCPLDEYPTAHP